MASSIVVRVVFTISVLFLSTLFLDCHRTTEADERPPVPPDRVLVFAFYNMENLFDPADDPTREGDDEFTPDGEKGWTEERLDRKLTNLARAIRGMNEYSGPDLLGVCEVENRRVLDWLTDEFLPMGVYRVAHAESPDERGIDVALIYKASVGDLLGVVMHPVDLGPGARPTRDIMEATFSREGKRFTVLVDHWPSRSGGETESAPRRAIAARTVAGIVDSLTEADPSADIVVMGDFNDEPDDRSIHDVLDAAPYSSEFSHRLINTAAPVAEADTLGSYFFRKDWETIDQIMLSRGALDSSGLMIYERSETIFAPDFLRDDRADPGFRPPYRTYKGNRFIGGTSDHFPVVLQVGWK